MKDKYRLTGVELHQEAVVVPAACSRTAWTPNTTVTVTLIVLSGTKCLSLLLLFLSLVSS